ncbi:hypothetical protein [Pelagicoccus sp. SDUM812002]|uniref:hypothetical protein n=1 Tax=Pelagicoccus sp. SDUM812002 TaxID=3041266 RepID=UPI00280EA62F|nr:hypothetical protein [Pelagicoccus sp. SDUM812002]MDQ8184878.1 hypothetical protein [Pelagicoccus sp. SDUM812002]
MSCVYNYKGYTPKDQVDDQYFPFIYETNSCVLSESIEVKQHDSDKRKLTIRYKAELDQK